MGTHHFQGLQGEGEGRRWEKGWGTGFWGTNPHRNSLRGPTCVQGGKKKPHPAHGKTHPVVRKHTSTRENTTFHTPKTGVPMRGEKTPPSCSKAQIQRRDWASLRGKDTHRREESHVHLSAAGWRVTTPQEKSQLPSPPPCLRSGRAREGRGGRPPHPPPIPEWWSGGGVACCCGW